MASAQCQASHRRRDEQWGVKLLSRASTLPAQRQGWQGDGCRGRDLAACSPHSCEARSSSSASWPGEGMWQVSVLAGSGEKQARSSSSSREELGMWASRKTACLLKGGSSYVLAWEICLAVQSTWWFTAPEESWCAYLKHLLTVDCLLSLLHKCSLACRVHQGWSRSYKQFDVSRCDRSSYDICFWAPAPSLPTPTHGKTDTAFKRKIHRSNGNMECLCCITRHGTPDVNKETYRTQGG